MSKIKLTLLFALLFIFVRTELPNTCSQAVRIYTNDYHCDFSEEMPKGLGANAIVFVVRKSRTNERFILKVGQLKKDEKFYESMNNICLEKLHGKRYIIQRHDIKLHDNMFYEILDYGESGNLSDAQENGLLNDQRNDLIIFKKIVEGVQIIHQNNIIHADLKMENIVLDKLENPMIIDFDMSVMNNTVNTNRGTFEYMDYVILRNWGNTTTRFTQEIDKWALGVLLYKMAFNEYPFVNLARNKKELLDLIVKGDISFPENAAIPLVNVILNLLRYDQNDRTSLNVLRFKIDNILSSKSWKYTKEKLFYNIHSFKPAINNISPVIQLENDKADKDSDKSSSFKPINILIILLLGFAISLMILYCIRKDKAKRQHNYEIEDIIE